jgi:hypothetical protein
LLAAAGLTALVCLLRAGLAGAEEVKFDVYEYQVEGNTVLPPTSVEKAVYEFLGPERTIDDVEKARAALEKAYRNAGFSTVIVSIPEQQVNEGVVKTSSDRGEDRARSGYGEPLLFRRVHPSASSCYPGRSRGELSCDPAGHRHLEFICGAARPPDFASRRASRDYRLRIAGQGTKPVQGEP